MDSDWNNSKFLDWRLSVTTRFLNRTLSREKNIYLDIWYFTSDIVSFGIRKLKDGKLHSLQELSDIGDMLLVP